MTEHRVELMQRFNLGFQRLGRHIDIRRQGFDVFIAVRQEFVQRRIKQANGHRQALHDLEKAQEVTLLHRQNLIQGTFTTFQVGREDHLTHCGDTVTFEEHMLCPAETDPFGTEVTGHLGIVRGIGVGANTHPTDTIDPLHQLAEFTGQLRLDSRHFALHDFTGRTIEGDHIAFLEDLAITGSKLLAGIINLDVTAAGNTALAHATSNHSRM